MKTIIALFLASASLASAQINTNSAPIFISFTNTLGEYITNAEVVSHSANKLIYRTQDGVGGGVIRLDKLPPELRVKFNYNPATVAAQDAKDKTKKDADEKRFRQQQQIYEQKAGVESAQRAVEKSHWDEAVKEAQSHQLELIGEVTAGFGPGKLVYLYQSQTTVLVTELPPGFKVDCIAYRLGNYKESDHWDEFGNEWASYYNEWTVDLDTAARFYLKVADFHRSQGLTNSLSNTPAVKK